MAEMFRSTLRLPYAKWSKAIDDQDLPRQRKMLALVDKVVNERYAPVLEQVYSDAFFYGAGFCVQTADGLTSISAHEVLHG